MTGNASAKESTIDLENVAPIVMQSTSMLQSAPDWRERVAQEQENISPADATRRGRMLSVVPVVHDAMKKALAKVIEDRGGDVGKLVIKEPTPAELFTITGQIVRPRKEILGNPEASALKYEGHVLLPTEDELRLYTLTTDEPPAEAEEASATVVSQPLALISPNEDDLEIYAGNKIPEPIMSGARSGFAQTIIRMAQMEERLEWHLNRAKDDLHHFCELAMFDPKLARRLLLDASEKCAEATELLATFSRGNERFVSEKERNCPHDAAASRKVADRIEAILQQELTIAVKNRTEAAQRNMPEQGTSEYDEWLSATDNSINDYLQRISDLLNESPLQHRPTPTLAR